MALGSAPLGAHAAEPGLGLSADAARTAIAEVLASPALAQPGPGPGLLATLAILALLGALALILAQYAKAPRHDPCPAPTYTPLAAPAVVGSVMDAAERAWPGSPVMALALLYQGLLARLESDYQLTVPASATEPEVLALISSLRLAGVEDLARRVIVYWQQARYAGRLPDEAAWAALVSSWRRLFPTDIAA